MIMNISMSNNGLGIWRKVLVLCKDFDCEDIVVTLEGDGDKGQIKGLDFQFYDELAIPKHAANSSIGVFDVDEGFTPEWEPLIKQKELTLADALKIVTYDILENNFTDWERKKSNTGTITYDIVTGEIKCEFSFVATVEGTFDFASVKKQVWA